MPIASQVVSSEVKRTNTSLMGDSNCMSGRNTSNSSYKAGAIYRRNELRFLLKENDILKKYIKMNGVGWGGNSPSPCLAEEYYVSVA